MIIMKKVLVLLTGLVASSMSMADTSSTDSDMHLYSTDYATKAETYQAGFDLQADLVNMNSYQLENYLSISGENVHNVKVNTTKVDVQEFANAEQEIVYRASVAVDYSYDYNDYSD